MNMLRLQELVDFVLISSLDIQAILSRELLSNDGDFVESIEFSGLDGVDGPTIEDEEWLHNVLVNNGDL